MALLEKIIYFSMACDEQQTMYFLSKNSYSIKDSQKLPKAFIKKSQDFFRKNRNRISLKNDDFSTWRCFCKYSSYEEVLPVVFIGILKYDEERVLWLLNISPDILSYRLHRGLSFLGEKLKEIPFKNNHFKFTNQNLNGIHKEALWYCQWLGKHDFSYERKSKIKNRKYLLIFLLSLIVLGIFISFFFLLPSSQIILYQSSF